MWINIKLCLQRTCIHVYIIVLVTNYLILVIVRVPCVFPKYKIIENIDFCPWRTKENKYKNVILFHIRIHS